MIIVKRPTYFRDENCSIRAAYAEQTVSYDRLVSDNDNWLLTGESAFCKCSHHFRNHRTIISLKEGKCEGIVTLCYSWRTNIIRKGSMTIYDESGCECAYFEPYKVMRGI